MKNIIFSLVFICVGYFNGFAQVLNPYYGVVSYSISPIESTNDINLTVISSHYVIPFVNNHTVNTVNNSSHVSICISHYCGLAMPSTVTTSIIIPNINSTGNQTIILSMFDVIDCIENPICNTNSYIGGPYTINFMGPITQSQTYVLANENFIKPSSKLYPNPNNGIFQIDLPNQLSEAQLEIFDFSGKEILVKEAYQSGTTVDISTLSAGLYFVKISTPEHSEILKFVVK